ncbi:MAG: ComEC/Rec2 family competence protein, partial [Vicinamibacterales bacterium]
MRWLGLLLTTAFTAGTALGVSVGAGAPGLGRMVLAAAWGVSVLAWGRGRYALQAGSALLAAVAAGWLLGGAAVAQALDPPLRETLDRALGGFAIGGPPAPRLDDPVTVEGRLLADAAVYEEGVGLRIAVTRVWIGRTPVAAPGGLAVTVGGRLAAAAAPGWRAGRQVRLSVRLRRPARYLNDGVGDQERAMARRGIALVGTVKSAALVEVTGEARWWDRAAAAVRARTRDVLRRRVGAADPQAGAVATAILIGDRAAITPEVQRRLQEAGTYHVVAISGGNIAILAALVLVLLSLAGAGPAASSTCAIAVLTAYAVVAGGGASVARATVMAVIYLAARLVDQRAAAATTVGLTAAVLLVADPLTVADVGAWLTFGATAAILLGAGRLPRAAGWWRHGGALLAASASAEAVLLPVAATVFERVTVAGLALNFIAIPSMTVVQVAAMATVACDVAGAGVLAVVAGDVTRTAAWVLLESGRLVDVAPWLAWRVPAPSPATVAAYYAALGTWWWAGRPGARGGGRRLARGAAVAALALGRWIAVDPPSRARAHGDGRLHLRAI